MSALHKAYCKVQAVLQETTFTEMRVSKLQGTDLAVGEPGVGHVSQLMHDKVNKSGEDPRTVFRSRHALEKRNVPIPL